MAAPFTVNYHDYMDETGAIQVDMECLKNHSGGQWVIRIGHNLSIFMSPARCKVLADALSDAEALTAKTVERDEDDPYPDRIWPECEMN